MVGASEGATYAFQSTLSVRRAACTLHPGNECREYFNPRSPCGERQFAVMCLRRRPNISIHALREESGHPTSQPSHSLTYFNPRSP